MPGLPLWVLRQRPERHRADYARLLALLFGAVGAPAPAPPPPTAPGQPRQPEAPPGPPAPTLPPVPPLPGQPGVITTRFGPVRPVEVSDVIRAVFPERAWVAAAEIAYLESGWRRDAVADTRGRGGGRCGVPYLLPDGTPATTEYSVGLYQVNICAHGGSFEQWADLYNNVNKARALWAARGERWSDWWISAGRLGLPR